MIRTHFNKSVTLHEKVARPDLVQAATMVPSIYSAFIYPPNEASQVAQPVIQKQELAKAVVQTVEAKSMVLENSHKPDVDLTFTVLTSDNKDRLMQENKNLFDPINLIEFLFVSLENFGDPLGDIALAVEFALSKQPGKGGSILVVHNRDELIGVGVMNNTNMKKYYPENYLAYLAVSKNFRGMRIGQKMLEYMKNNIKGDISLHCDPENPAIHLYKKMGFKSKYVEMRLFRE